MPATILTDSLSTVEALQSPNKGPKSALLTQLLLSLDKLDTMPTIAWIPSHAGIKGNEAVDKIAKNGAACSSTEKLRTPHELKDELRLIDQHSLARWQAAYDAQLKGAAYRALEPKVSAKVKFVATTRSKETMLTRLRLGQCRLNKYLHQMRSHPDGLCTACKLHPETISHFLLECTENNTAARLKEECLALQLEPSMTSILGNRDLQDLVYKQVLVCQRKI